MQLTGMGERTGGNKREREEVRGVMAGEKIRQAPVLSNMRMGIRK